MSALRIGSLFSGYGGLDMAVKQVFGASTAWVSDIDRGACKILAHRYPDVPNLGDITVIDWSTVEPVDIITGGSPCQDLSPAGKRAGMSDGTRSNLWVAMREAIAELEPTYVVWENVRGAYSAAADSALEHCPGCMGDGRPGTVLRALGRVLGDLSDLGYDAAWHGLRAADVGAPHGRFRVFVLAWRRDAAHATGDGRDEGWPESAGIIGGSDAALGGHANVTLLPTPEAKLGSSGPDYARMNRPGTGGDSLHEAVGRLLPTPTRRDHKDHMIRREPHRPNDTDTLARALTDFGQYAAAIQRWEAVTRMPAPAPTEPTGRNGAHRLSPAFTEWMMGLPAGWITDVPGITRNEELRACGNGVVPQQAVAALHTLLAAMHQEAAA